MIDWQEWEAQGEYEVLMEFERFSGAMDYIVSGTNKHLSAWRQVADAFSPDNPVRPRDVAPEDVACPDCWDTGLCSECFGRGEYETCPALCGDGRCHCQQEEPDDEPE